MSRKKTVKELLDIKTRDKYRSRVHIYFSRVADIRNAFEESEFSGELLRYFPIAIIAAVESYFRASYAEMLDLGEPYASRIEPLIRDLRIGWRAVRAIEGKHVTSGEVVAHSLPLSSLGDIQRIMNALLDADFLHLLRGVQKPGLVDQGDERDLAISNPD